LARWQTSLSTLSDIHEDTESSAEVNTLEADTFSIPIRRTTEEASMMPVPSAPKRVVETNIVERNEITTQEESPVFVGTIERQKADEVDHDRNSQPYFALTAMTVPVPPYLERATPAHSSHRVPNSSTKTRSRSARPLRQVAVVMILLMVAVAGTTFYEARPGAQSLTAAAGDSYLETFAVEIYRTIAGFFGAQPPAGLEEDTLARTDESAPVSDTSASVKSDSSNTSGLVVFESPETEAERQNRIDQVKRSFSDEVIVNEDDLGGSGTIQPVFRSGPGNEYVYVLVPINKDSQTASTSTSSSLGTP
jgi:hypothetical protein